MNDTTAIEKSRLSELETTIERGQQTFIEVGLALAEIRDSRLYREGFATFEEYCKDRWGWNASRSRQLIGAAEAVAEMQSVTIVTDAEKESVNVLTLPPVQNARQAAELAKIKDPIERVQVWEQVNEAASEVAIPVTAKLIESVAAIHNGNGNGAVAKIIDARNEHLTQVKNSPATRWTNFLYEIQVNINSIRDNGGIAKLAGRWSASDKEGYLNRLKRLREAIDHIAEQLEGAINYDRN